MDTNMVEEIKTRTYRYYYEDGLVETAVGLQFALIGAALWAVSAWLEGPLFALGLSLGLFLLILAGTFGVKWLVGNLKARVTYPRTGAVTYRAQPDRRRWRMVLVIMALVLISFVLPERWTQSGLIVGIMLAVITLYMGYRVSLLRLQVEAVVPLGVAILSIVLAWGEVQGVAIVFLSSGSVMALIGLLVFRRYLRVHPAQADE